jgi:hypothetical protein
MNATPINPENIVVEDVHVLHKMRQFGGSFVRALAEAGFCADSVNLAKIKATWPDLWKEYEAWGAGGADHGDRGEAGSVWG